MDVAGDKIIPLSRKKALLAIFGCCVFIALGAWMIQTPAEEILAQRRHSNPLFVHAIGFVAIAFFSLCGIIATVKLFDRNPGLILNSAGIFDNSSGVSAGLIPWEDIAGFTTYRVQKQRVLVICLYSPQKYIDRCNFFMQLLLKINGRLSGSPIAITSTALKISFDELLSLCNMYFHKYGR